MAASVALTRRVLGCHCIHRFGRLDTEEFARWRGEEPVLPSLLK